MTKHYKLSVTQNLTLELPLIKDKDLLYYSFNILGNQKLNKILASLLHESLIKKNIVPDTILTVEAKAIGLVEQLSTLFGIEKYCVIRKSKKSYMTNPISSNGTSIISRENVYWLDENDLNYLKGKRVIFCDDVISTGGTIKAISQMLEKYNIRFEAYVAAMTEGTDWKNLFGTEVIKIGHFPLPERYFLGEKND